MDANETDLLYGVPAIAEHLKLGPRQVRYLIDLAGLPTFRLGGKICARKAALAAWIATAAERPSEPRRRRKPDLSPMTINLK